LARRLFSHPYKGVLSIKDKTTWFEKEYHHRSEIEGYSGRLKEKQFDLWDNLVNLQKQADKDKNNDKDKYETPWIGIKFIVYHIDNRKHAKCELWVDKKSPLSINDPTQQDWVKVHELEDKGD